MQCLGDTVSDFRQCPERCNRNFAGKLSPDWVVRGENRDIPERSGIDQGHLGGKRQVAAGSPPGKHMEKSGVSLCNGEETALTAEGTDGRKTTQPHGFSSPMGETQPRSSEDF